MLDYKLIEALAVVAREGGFDKAANHLHITQSAVSQRIKLLEEQTGQILIARTTPPEATKAGHRMIKHYLQVKQLESDLLEDVQRDETKSFSTFAVGINADSLETWFLDAIEPLLKDEQILLDTLVDDQDQTHRMLKDGHVIGCISTKDQPLQGCRVEYLGYMNYSLMATPAFIKKWFKEGFTFEAAHKAPAVIFNRKDELHHRLLKRAFGRVPKQFPINYIPSTEQFARFIEKDLGYGMLPEQQVKSLLAAGCMVDIAPEHTFQIKLYYHCWNLKSKLLQKIATVMTENAKSLLNN